MTSRPLTDASLLDVPTAESTFRDVNGVRLHVVAAGVRDGPLVVLLHGFPEFWYCWHRHVRPLVEAGYRVLVPDQRGYNRSEKPAETSAYRTAELARDVVGLIETEDRTSARVVGHDWGAAVAWDLALRCPERVERLGILNVPHPSAFARTLRSSPRQLRKSWYAFAFQVPWLPERYVELTGFRPWIAAMRDGSKPGTFTEEDLRRYRAAWARDGAPTAMIRWYRARARHRERPSRDRVTAPTVILWGENDRALVPELAPKSAQYCDEVRLERFPDATHWVHHEHPERTAELLLDHLGS